MHVQAKRWFQHDGWGAHWTTIEATKNAHDTISRTHFYVPFAIAIDVDMDVEVSLVHLQVGDNDVGEVLRVELSKCKMEPA